MMMNERILKSIKMLAALAIVFGIVMTTSCSGDDEKDKCTADVTFYADADGDGLGALADTQLACEGEQPEGYVTNSYDSDDNTASTSQSVYAFIAATPGLDSLQKYLEVYPDLVGLLSGTGTFTVFAPNNAAFISLLATPGFPSNISSINPDIIKNVLAYHVAVTEYTSESLTSGTTIPTASLGNELITVSAQGNLKTGSSNPEIEIEFADINVSNGVVHVVKSVLIPPTVGATLTPILGTNAGTLLLGAPFSILAQAILKADTFATVNSQTTIVSILAGTAKHTVFTPTNETFITAGGGADLATQAEKIAAGLAFIKSIPAQSLYGLLLNHIVIRETNIAASELITGAEFTTALQSKLLIYNNTEVVPATHGLGIYINSNGRLVLTDPTTYVAANFNAEVVFPGAVTNPNGTIHIIGGLLSPPTGN